MKCFGERPACTRCVRKDEICIYDAAEGVSRQQDLRTRLHSAEAELRQARGFIHNLQHSSNEDAALLLTRLRLGEDVAELASKGARRSVRYHRSLEVLRPTFLTFQGGRLRHIIQTTITMVCPHKLRPLTRSKHKRRNPTYQSTLLWISRGKM